MSNLVLLLKSLLIYGISISLALVLGYKLATPLESSSVLWIGIVLAVLSLPFFISRHHTFLILTWNIAMIVFFLPGQLPFYIFSAFLSFGMAVFSHSINKEANFLNIPSVTWPLLFLTVVVIVTAQLTGGIGMRALGSDSFGGKQFVHILAAIAGYFALTSRQIPPQHAVFWASAFFLSGTTAIISNIIYFSHGALDFLLIFFPLEMLGNESTLFGGFNDEVFRLRGLAFGAEAFCFFMFIRFGIRKIFNLQHSWRLGVILLSLGAILLGGFRSTLLFVIAVFVVQFFLEGLHHTRLLPTLLLFSVLMLAGVATFSAKLPLAVQRSISFLPLDLDPMAKKDAEDSSEWRFSMWKVLWPQVPQHLLVGKGFKIDATDLYMAGEAQRRGWGDVWDVQVLVGNYHSGPLSLILPLGMFGVIAFLWFLWAGGKVLYNNYKFGTSSLQIVNTFLWSTYLVRIPFYFIIFGSFYSELYLFTGLIGLSISLNGGMKTPDEENLNYEPKLAVNKKALVEVPS